MKKYSVRDEIPEDARHALAEYPELLQKLLYYRGIETAESARIFLNPDYDLHTHDPFLLKDMKRAVERIFYALEHGEKIVIYSDYDCDGIPGGVLLHDLFMKIGYTNFENYIPHRHEEGYGLNLSAVEKCAEGGAKLLITVDCGTTDTTPIARARELGLDVIITDHHLVPENPPPAYAIINPKQKNDRYPFDMLCGTGVAFKLVQAILQGLSTSNFRPQVPVVLGWEKWLLDMVGLATIADMVPLTGENRVLAHYGLAVFRKSPRPGLLSLCRIMRVAKHLVTEDDIGFMVAPRINAASRMGQPSGAFRLLATRDDTEAHECAKHLHALSGERKGLVANMVKEVKKQVARRDVLPPVIVLGNPLWRPALLGLVANSLTEKYKRPVFLWGRDGGETLKGSCRSWGGVNVVSLMEAVSHIFIDFGGHAFSGGFSLLSEKVHTFESALLQAYTLLPKGADGSEPECFIDTAFSLDDVSWATYAHIEKLAPFGEDNPKPVFLFKNTLISAVEQFGKEKNHLRLVCERDDGTSVSAIGFFSSPENFSTVLKTGIRVDLVAAMEKSLFRYTPELRLRIVDIL